jgi:hypothetical protein
MKHLNNNPYSTHHDISLLLPWYVNNTLRSAELQNVENHLKVCLTCKRELLALRKLSVAVQQEGSFDSAALASFSHLKNRIHATDNENKSTAIFISKPTHGATNRFAVKASFSFALAAALVLALVIPGYVNIKQPTNDFRTLSNSDIAKSHNNEIRVVFANDVTKQQMETILSDVHGKIVGGPTEQSVYTIQITTATSKKEVLARVEKLRQNPNVIFAEPAYALLSSGQTDQGTNL